MPRLKPDSSLVGRRLDEVLAKSLSWPREKAKEAIKKGLVSLNGKVLTKPSTSYKEGDLIDYEEPAEKVSALIPEEIPLRIVYEDEDLMVIDKPQGLLVHPGNGHPSGTLANALLYREQSLYGEATRPGIVHRIDKDTSGLLAVAKTKVAYDGLKKQLEDHSMHRIYYAIVLGNIAEDEAKIDAPLARNPSHPLKYKVVGKGGKEAITYFKVLERFEDYSFLELRLLTGRTHQIRAHLEYIGHPVEGDPLYGKGNRKLYQKGQLLHAGKLVFKHPRDGREMEFEAPLPDYFKEALDSLRPVRRS